eukprot:1177518-Prorocentrum_minimum.AAC.3
MAAHRAACSSNGEGADNTPETCRHAVSCRNKGRRGAGRAAGENKPNKKATSRTSAAPPPRRAGCAWGTRLVTPAPADGSRAG